MGSAIENLIDPNGNLVWNSRIYGHYEDGKVMFNGWKSGENELQIQITRIQDCSIKDDYLTITVEDGKTYLYEGNKIEAPPPKFLTPRRGLPLNDLLRFVEEEAPNFKDYVYTDILKLNAKYIDMSFFDGDEKLSVKSGDRKLPIDDEDSIGITTFRMWVEDRSFYRYTISENGFFKPINGGPISPSENLSRQVLKKLADQNKRNFFIEKIENFILECEFKKLNGDGPISLLEHREYDLFDRVGVDAPQLKDENERKTYCRGVFRWILCQAITLQLNPDSDRIDLAVVLYGKQKCGKSSLCRNLFGEFSTDGIDLDSVKGFVETTSGIVGVEIPEILKQLAKKNNRLLKNLISLRKPNIRVSYGRSAKSYRLPFVMLFTTNDPQPLIDVTGDRRYAALHKIRTEYTEDPKRISEDDYLGYWALMFKEIKDTGITPTEIYENEIEPYAEKAVSSFEDDPLRHMYLEEVLGQYPNVGDKVPIIVIKDGLRDVNGAQVCFGLKKYKDDGYISDYDIERNIDDLKTAPDKWGFGIYRNDLSMNTTLKVRGLSTTTRGWLVREKPIDIDVTHIFQ